MEDLDRDGYVDLVVSNTVSGTVSVLDFDGVLDLAAAKAGLSSSGIAQLLNGLAD